MLIRISFLLLFISFSAVSNDDALSLDRVVPQDFELAFPNDNNIQPDISDFEVLYVALMSNEIGERWAVVTINNTANGRRTLSHKHLMALVANGDRIRPLDISQSFTAGETLSLTINFGASKFPLLAVYSRLE